MEGFISSEEMQTIKQSLETQSLDSAAEKIQDHFDQLDKMVLNIAVTGASGKGKSTFINTIRGLGDEEEGSAPTGVVETTMEPTPYPYPEFPNIKMWDLPGIGTENFRPDQYLEQVEFKRYDFFIIVSSERFTCNDANLAREIQKMGKHFYFARSKIDQSLEGEKRKKKYDEKAVLDLIQQDCITGLQKLGVECPRVFLISSFDPEKYDFPLLQEEMEKDLPQEQRHIFLLALPGITESIIQRKKEMLQGDIWQAALLSGAASAAPVPGLGFATDLAILVKELSKYRTAFGLDEASLKRLADRVNVPVEELKRATKSGLAEEISKEMIINMLMTILKGGNKETEQKQSLAAAIFEKAKLSLIGVGVNVLMWSDEFLHYIPVIGTLAAGGIGFTSTYLLLKFCLNELAKDAQLVLLRAFEK